ncbi:enoyl-CoA hydratase/isomerase family protein [Mucilaginibacter glaciei]|uniref:Enoyl-CoA hydratase/isomerase family protein n=1 Tax=Mucilaginibacter glaciei TaxID=2772109 RepID=A0A926NXV1_9SPHI|nr:enoyl-CoA hydratase-related protein [Mucilaginibacter glaciei]MBD1393838.1 enoyl-CoA hydratase/isomerase family protein [Mucilaginibacter glaciei]
MEFENILVEGKGRIQYITINRESKLNALNKLTLLELHDAFTAAFADDKVGGIIITGAGTKAFVAGADITEFAELDVAGGEALSREGHNQVFDLIANSSKPVIAAINGFALGGGLELAMACHIRIASDNARMGLPEVTLGLIPGYGGTQRLTRLIGRGKALEMIMTADMVTADQALASGLVNHVTTPADLLPKAEELLTRILSRAPLAIAAAIRCVNDAGRDGVNGFDTEIKEFGACFGTEDFKEGVVAFLEKRKANFTGN